MAAVPLPPQLQTGGRSTLADLQPAGRLAEWYDSCKRSHEHFAVRGGGRSVGLGRSVRIRGAFGDVQQP
jgi:hypothetical protein